MHNRNIVKVRIADVSYYLRNARYYYFHQKDRWRCIVYLESVKRYIEDTLSLFKKF